MENFKEKFTELKDYIDHSGQQDLADCVRYLEKVILPFSDKLEKACTAFYEELFEIDAETKEAIQEFTELTKTEYETEPSNGSAN